LPETRLSFFMSGMAAADRLNRECLGQRIL